MTYTVLPWDLLSPLEKCSNSDVVSDYTPVIVLLRPVHQFVSQFVWNEQTIRNTESVRLFLPNLKHSGWLKCIFRECHGFSEMSLALVMKEQDHEYPDKRLVIPSVSRVKVIASKTSPFRGSNTIYDKEP